MSIKLDDLQCSNLRIYQDTERFCFGRDAVLLSGFAEIKRNMGIGFTQRNPARTGKETPGAFLPRV